ncbi:aspartate carbamoyltransferase regulatory subunit [Patescibacteria group bacterium]|nr:aspartate carbamoyltransferase regulatory subunit [Patescibacteria group bacterium]MBU1890727.1 aspartate carbamoyltransferase regulatory subunit [Patescibacteria group bacterium]
MKHVISAADFERSWVDEVLERATRFIGPYRSGVPVGTRPEKVTIFMGEASTRTGNSYAEAARLLGCPTDLIPSGDLTSLIKGESLGATGRMLCGQGAKVIPIRTKIEGGARWLSEMFAMKGYEYDVAVHNCGDGANQHPSQALLDLLTIQQRLGRTDNMTVGFVGDLRNSRTVHSLVLALRLFSNIKLVLVSSPQVKLPNWYYEGIETVVADTVEALKGCDIVCVTRVQRERFDDEVTYQRVRGLYSIGAKTLEMLGDKTLIMNVQPICAEDLDIHPEIWRHPQVIMDYQAKMGMPTRMALLEWSLEHLQETDSHECPAPTIRVVSEGSASEAIARKRAQQQYFIPIERGTVIDRITQGMVARVELLLDAENCNGDGAVLPLKKLKTDKLPWGLKDVLVVENGFFTDEQLAMVSVLAPDVVFNEIRDDRLIKRRVEFVSHITAGQCPNTVCVTDMDVEAALYPHFHVLNGGGSIQLKCHFCERHFRVNEVFS